MKSAKHKSSHPQQSDLPFLSYLFSGLSELGNPLSLFNYLNSQSRIGLSIMFGMGMFVLLPSWMNLKIRLLGAWVAGIICFLTLVFHMMSGATPEITRNRVQRQESQHASVFLLVILTACTSIFAIGLMQADIKKLSPTVFFTEVGLSIASLVCSWCLTHMMFVLHYATCYYRKNDPSGADEDYVGGLGFPGDVEPDFLDFVYYGFTIGMTAQTSDVDLISPTFQGLGIAHALISFFFYVVILASAVNAASGLI